MSKIEQLEKQLSEIQSEIEQLKGNQELEEGQWVYIKTATPSSRNDHRDVGIITEEWSRETQGVRVCVFGKSDENIANLENPEELRHASTSEISEALIAEAKRRGLDSGDTKCLHDGEKRTLTWHSPGWEYDSVLDILWWYNKVVYEQGQWAEKEPTEEPIEINGYEVKFFGDHVQVACALISNEWLKETASISKNHDVGLYRKGEDITKQIHQISEKL